MTLTNDAKAVVALTTRLGERKRPSLTAKMWHQLANALTNWGRHPSDVFSNNFDPGAVPGIDHELAARIATLLKDGASTTLEADELSRKGIWTVTIVDETYPRSLVDRLGDQAPPVLFGCGDPHLMSTPGIGVVGSRNIHQAAGKVAMAVGQEAVSLGFPVVSGAARGVDQQAMRTAYQAGGEVIGVLADSLIGRIRRPDTLEVLDAGNTCLISQQVPTAGFTAGAAMGRNKLVYALSTATVVVASTKDSGGTWSGAIEAIRKRNGIVVVWRGDGEGPGNAELEKLGAKAIRSTGELRTVIQSEPEIAEQLKLDIPG